MGSFQMWKGVFVCVLVASLLVLSADAGPPSVRPKATSKGDPVRTASKKHGLDPSNFLVVVIAALTLVYGASRALKPPFVDMGVSGNQEAYEELAEAGEMQLHTTFMFVFVASGSLVLIFFFMSAMSVLITILFCFISSVAVGNLVYPYVDRYTNNKYAREVEVPVLGEMPLLALMMAPFCFACAIAWVLTKSWILNNILAFSLIIFFLTSVRLSSLKVASSLLLLAFCYDIFWVFISSSIFGKNVMVTVATGLNVPIKILVPLVFAHGKHTHFTLIGLGDIVLPGLLLCFAMRYDDAKRIDSKGGYFAACMVGYCVGLTICEYVVGTYHWAQPAMIYLVPGTLIPFTWVAYNRNEIADVWEGLRPGRLDKDLIAP
uniref:Signal peptide peptidase n=1 Tax=Hemiselmis andersenii TaxID=464988 RepID=A0A6U4JMI3_HEMAN|mmetsp:Transcript_26840/g.62148  ORF Transcript_26840/g.62148 Transcript_26840/m.62148 type:complete len:376 (+) Transcript_26840:132-1259(+)